MKNLAPLFATTLLFSCTSMHKKPSSIEEVVEKTPTPYEIVAQAPKSEWRNLNQKDALYLELPAGTVVIELAPEFTPAHVQNTKALVREGIFNNTSFYLSLIHI